MKKSEKRQRTEYVIVCLLPSERQAFEERCNDAGVSKADYFRQKCLQSAPLRKRKSVRGDIRLLTQYLAQVGKIGSNLNQLAHRQNQGLWLDEQEVKQALEAVLEMRDVLRKSIGYDR